MANAYTRINVGGKTLNARTAAQFEQLKKIYRLIGGTGTVYLTQGSYNRGGVSQSAGTHDGGGALDCTLSNATSANWTKLQQAFRWVQIAGWHRTPSQGDWGHHVHGISIGDTEASYGAKRQVDDYYNRKNGLAGHARDTSWRPNVIFPARYPFANVSLSVSVMCAKKPKGNVIPRSHVKWIQRALNRKRGAGLVVDGKFGPKTKQQYKYWEKQFPGATADGIPGDFTLSLLGAGLFNVTK